MSPAPTPKFDKAIPMLPPKKRSGWPVTLVVVVIILAGGWWFFLQPEWQAYRALPSLDGYAASRQAVEKEISALKKIIKEYSQVTATDEQRLRLALPPDEDLPNLLAQFEGLAETTDFTLTSIGFSSLESSEPATVVEDINGLPMQTSSTPTSNVKELRVNVNIKGGDYGELKKFVAAAEQSIRLLRLMSLNFSSGASGSEGLSYTLNFLTTYMSK